MKKFFSMVCACLLALSAQATDIKKYDALYENLPFQMEKVTRPQFPANEVNLKDFGAIGDGSSLCTTAFAKAIDALTQKGGGKLIVPQGVWFTGPIVLKSNINLHLEKGAVILFSPDDALYPFVETSFEGLDTRRCQSPISGHNLTNVAITGQGCIDGNGEYWRPLKKQKVTDAQWKQITSRGGAFKRADYWFPSEGALKADNSANSHGTGVRLGLLLCLSGIRRAHRLRDRLGSDSGVCSAGGHRVRRLVGILQQVVGRLRTASAGRADRRLRHQPGRHHLLQPARLRHRAHHHVGAVHRHQPDQAHQ